MHEPVDDITLTITRYLDGQLTSDETAAFADHLREDSGARRLLITLAEQSRQLAEPLHDRLTGDQRSGGRLQGSGFRVQVINAERGTQNAERNRPASVLVPRSAFRVPTFIALAAAIALAVTAWFLFTPSPESPAPVPVATPSVATLTNTHNAEFANTAAPMNLGGSLPAGPIQLTSGTAQVMFASTAVVDLTGPCEFEITGPNRGRLTAGRLQAYVRPEAHGFTVDLPDGSRVVDLGTAFTLSLNDVDGAELRVNEGRVRLEFDPDDRATHHLVTAGTRAVISLAERSVRHEELGVAINVNFFADAPPSDLLGPAGGRSGTWNQFSTKSAIDLLDVDGYATTVGFESAGSGWGRVNRWGDPALAMIRDGHRTFDVNLETTWQELTITGLEPGDRYDVYIASAIIFPTQRSQGEWRVLNPSGGPPTQTVDNTRQANGDSWQRGNNFVLFEAVEVDEDGAIRLTGKLRRDSSYDTRLPLNGFQLRPAGRSNQNDNDASSLSGDATKPTPEALDKETAGKTPPSP